MLSLTMSSQQLEYLPGRLARVAFEYYHLWTIDMNTDLATRSRVGDGAVVRCGMVGLIVSPIGGAGYVVALFGDKWGWIHHRALAAVQ